jgi:hypothetical protein
MGRDAFEILGETIVAEVAGAPASGFGGGFDSSFLINAASEVAQRGVTTVEQKQAAERSAKDVAAQLQRAIAADAAWASAEQLLDLASQSRDPTRVAAATSLAQSTSAEASGASAGLTPEAVGKRVSAATAASKQAAQDSLAAPGDPAKAALVRAWQKVAARAAVGPQVPGGFGGAGPGHGGALGGSFLGKMYGGVPVWGWGIGGVAIFGGLFMLLRRK